MVSIATATPTRSSMALAIRRGPFSTKGPSKEPMSPIRTGQSAALETPKSRYRSLRVACLVQSSWSSMPITARMPLAKRARWPTSVCGFNPPIIWKRANPEASIWETTRPISSMWAATITLVLPWGLTTACRLPMEDMVSESANPLTSCLTRSRTSSSCPEGPKASVRRRSSSFTPTSSASTQRAFGQARERRVRQPDGVPPIRKRGDAGRTMGVPGRGRERQAGDARAGHMDDSRVGGAASRLPDLVGKALTLGGVDEVLQQPGMRQGPPVGGVYRRTRTQASVVGDVLLAVPGGQVVGRGAIQHQGGLGIEQNRRPPGPAQPPLLLHGESRQQFDPVRGVLYQLDQGGHTQPVVQRLGHHAGPQAPEASGEGGPISRFDLGLGGHLAPRAD